MTIMYATAQEDLRSEHNQEPNDEQVGNADKDDISVRLAALSIDHAD